MLVDEVVIEAQAGKGGRGCLSFRREKFVPRGGPDGGDGGDGGDIVFEAVTNVSTLLEVGRQRHYRAGNGRGGLGSNKAGKDGADLVIEVPVGTIVKDAGTGMVLKEFLREERVVMLKGGRGGRGNARFATATNQVPKKFEPGEPGEARTLLVELKLVADVGLLGFPNAGKSTLLAAMTGATPRVADYPFTTLEPYLGIVEFGKSRRFVMADIPGLIEGASEGRGLGFRFLRHVERTRVLLHMLDGNLPAAELVQNYRVIRKELEGFSEGLAARHETVVLSKADVMLPSDAARKAREIEAEISRPVTVISAHSHVGLKTLVTKLADALSDEKNGFKETDGA